MALKECFCPYSVFLPRSMRCFSAVCCNCNGALLCSNSFFCRGTNTFLIIPVRLILNNSKLRFDFFPPAKLRKNECRTKQNAFVFYAVRSSCLFLLILVFQGADEFHKTVDELDVFKIRSFDERRTVVKLHYSGFAFIEHWPLGNILRLQHALLRLGWLGCNPHCNEGEQRG